MHNFRNVIFLISELGGGVTRYSLNHAKELQKKGVSVYIFNDSTKWINDLKEIEGIPFFNVNLSIHSFNKKIIELQLLPDYTSFICTEGFELEFFYSNRLKFHLVYILHGDYPYYINNAIKYVGIIDSIGCVSKSIYNQLCGHRLIYFKKRVFYIPHRLEKIQKISLNNKEKNSIAFIGRPTREKGFDIILELIKKLESQNIFYNWYFFGFEVPANLNLSVYGSKIECNGQLQHNELIKRLSRCQFLILPSTHEGLPLSVLEALNYLVTPICNFFNLEIKQYLKVNEVGHVVDYNDVNSYFDILHKHYFSADENSFKVELRDRVLKQHYNATMNEKYFVYHQKKYFKNLQIIIMFILTKIKFSVTQNKYTNHLV